MAVGTPQTNSGNSVTPTVNVPTGVAAGDIVVLDLSVDNSGSTLATKWPSGFTNVLDVALTADGQRVGRAWKRLTAADTGSYTMTSIGGTGNWNYVMSATPVTGRHATDPPVLGTATNSNAANASGTVITATGVTAVAGDDLLHSVLLDVTAAGAWSSFSAWSATQIVALEGPASPNQWAAIGVGKIENVGAGATGNKSVTVNLSSAGAGYSTSLLRIPAAAGGTTQVSATRRVAYSVQAQVAATRRVSYGVLAGVAATRRVVYGVAAAVLAARAVRYDVQAPVVASRRTVYDVAASTSQVTAPRRVGYSVSAQVSTARRVLYDVVRGAAATRIVSYSVMTSASATRRVAYSVAGNVNAPRHIIYTVDGPVGPPVVANVRVHIGTRAPSVPTITVRQ